MGPIQGYDKDETVVRKARSNFNRSGMKGVRFDAMALEKLTVQNNLTSRTGLIAVNPPYGIRLEERVGLEGLYRRLGQFYKEQLPYWQLSLITPDKELGMALRLPVFPGEQTGQRRAALPAPSFSGSGKQQPGAGSEPPGGAV